MPLDITRLIEAVDRKVETRDHQGRPARVARLARSYPTTQDDLWDAITNPERIPRWFMPVSGDLRPGGHYQLEGNAGGEITACEPPRHLALTWVMGDQESWVTVDLSEAPDGGTQLLLEHVAHVPDDFWDQYGPGAVGVGWDHALLGLDQLFATDASVPPESALEWMVSDEGKAFARASSDAWGRASIAAGTPLDAAERAAEETRAFYTGEPVSPPER